MFGLLLVLRGVFVRGVDMSVQFFFFCPDPPGHVATYLRADLFSKPSLNKTGDHQGTEDASCQSTA